MNTHGKIAICDAISCYDDTSTIKTAPFDYLTIVDKRIRLEGFSVLETDGWGGWKEAVGKMAQWVGEVGCHACFFMLSWKLLLMKLLCC